MNQRKLAFSIVLGTMLTLGLLATLSVSPNSTAALAEGPEAAARLDSDDVIRAQDAVSTAHLAVQFSNGDTAVRPITWTGTITRIGAMEAAGFDVEHDSQTVCAIEGDGCPSDDCFCDDNLWAQGQWAGTAWDTSAWPPPSMADTDVIAFRNGTQPDYGDWGLSGFLPAAETYVAASDALEWMRDQQRSNGSYPSWSGPVAGSVRALVALGSAGYDPAKWGSPSLLSFLTVVSKTETVEYVAASASNAGKLALGAVWTDQEVTDFASLNLPVSVTAFYSPTTGGYGNGSGDTAWAILGLHAAGEDIPTQTIDFLKDVQIPDGGWSWNEWGTTSEVQHTALCVQALLAAGEPVSSTTVASAMAFIDSGRNDDGGYGYQVSSPSGVNTTAYVIQSLLSLGQTPAGNWCAPIRCSYLLSEQEEDGSYGGFSPLYATQETIPALMHRPYGPLAPWMYNCYVNHLPLVVKH